MKCVECSAISSKGEGKIFGNNEANGIKIDCSGNPVLGDGQCESACGSDASCDEKDTGDCIAATKQKCSNTCAPVTSCGDGAVNCGESCEAGQCTGAITKCNAACSGSATSCGDWANNCGEAVNTCRSDVCGTSSIRYNMNDLIGGDLAAGGTASQVTCGLGTGFTGSGEDWFEVTTSQSGYLRVELESIPFACDWDIYVYNTGLAELFRSETGICMESKTSPTSLPAGTYLIKVRRISGNGQGDLRVRLWECVSDANCGFNAGHIKRKCDCPLVGCGQDLLAVADYTCTDPVACPNTDECDLNYCCETDINKDANGDGDTDDCVGTGSKAQQYLCT